MFFLFTLYLFLVIIPKIKLDKYTINNSIIPILILLKFKYPITVITKTGLGKNDISKILSASLILIILLFNASFIYSALDGIPLNKERIIIVKSLLLIFNVLLIIFNFNFDKYPCKL